MKLPEEFYDNEKKRFKNNIVVFYFFILAMIVSFIISMMMDFPLITTVSAFLFILGIVTMMHDHWVLNSMIVPMIPMLVIVVLQDVHDVSILGGIFHVSILVMGFIALFRKDTAFFLMLFIDILYGAWMYSVKRWAGFLYYDEIFGVYVSDETQIILSISLGIILSIVISLKNWYLSRRKDRPFDCPGGWCPL